MGNMISCCDKKSHEQTVEYNKSYRATYTSRTGPGTENNDHNITYTKHQFMHGKVEPNGREANTRNDDSKLEEEIPKSKKASQGVIPAISNEEAREPSEGHKPDVEKCAEADKKEESTSPHNLKTIDTTEEIFYNKEDKKECSPKKAKDELNEEVLPEAVDENNKPKEEEIILKDEPPIEKIVHQEEPEKPNLEETEENQTPRKRKLQAYYKKETEEEKKTVDGSSQKDVINLSKENSNADLNTSNKYQQNETDDNKKKTVFVDKNVKEMMEKRSLQSEKNENIYQNILPELKAEDTNLQKSESQAEKSKQTIDSNEDADTEFQEKKRHTVYNHIKRSVFEENRRKSVTEKNNQKILILSSERHDKHQHFNQYKVKFSFTLTENSISELIHSKIEFYQDGERHHHDYEAKGKGTDIELLKEVEFEYDFEKLQLFVITINSEKVSHDHRVSFGKILTSPDHECTLETDHYKIHLKTEIVNSNQSEVLSVFSVKYCLKLLSMTVKRVTYKLWRIHHKDDKEMLYESEEQANQKAFQFCDAFINKAVFHQKNDQYVFEVYEKENLLGKTRPLAFQKFELLTKPLELVDSKNKEISAKLEVIYTEKKPQTFIDYLADGMRLRMFVSIDFTSSNLSCYDKDSLHCIDGVELNIYEQLITKIGSNLQNYDPQEEITVFGFGGIPPIKDEVSHSFYVNLKNEPVVVGLENVLKHYREILPKIKLLGPTYFKFFLKQIIDKVKKSVQNNENIYFVSLILTDGYINDIEETTDLFVEASKLPISFIIIGVGTGDFINMNIFDGNRFTLYNSKGEKALRDAVHFAIFQEHSSYSHFAEKTLKHIPSEIEQYYRTLTQKD